MSWTPGKSSSAHSMLATSRVILPGRVLGGSRASLMVLIIRCWSKWSSWMYASCQRRTSSCPFASASATSMPSCSSRFRWSGRCFGSTTWKARSPVSKPSLMNGISTRYSSSFEWKKAHTWQERLRTDPANRTGCMVSVMVFSIGLLFGCYRSAPRRVDASLHRPGPPSLPDRLPKLHRLALLPKKLGGLQQPGGHFGSAQSVKDVPPLPPFGDDSVRTEDHQVLGNPGMADPQRVLQGFHVTLAVTQLLNDANAVRVPKGGEEVGKPPGHENSVRHGSSPSCSKIQKLECKVGSEGAVAKTGRLAYLDTRTPSPHATARRLMRPPLRLRAPQ